MSSRLQRIKMGDKLQSGKKVLNFKFMMLRKITLIFRYMKKIHLVTIILDMLALKFHLSVLMEGRNVGLKFMELINKEQQYFLLIHITKMNY